MSDFDLAKELYANLRDPESEVHRDIQRDLDEIAEKAAAKARRETPKRTGHTASSIHAESGSDKEGLPEAYVAADGYRATRYGAVANATILNALGNKFHETMNANQYGDHGFRTAHGTWVHDAVWSESKLWGAE